MTLSFLQNLGRAWRNSAVAALLGYLWHLVQNSLVWRALFAIAGEVTHGASLLDKAIGKVTDGFYTILRPFSRLYHNSQKSSAMGLLGDSIEQTAVFTGLSCLVVMVLKKALLGGFSVKWLILAFALLAVAAVLALIWGGTDWLRGSILIRWVNLYLPLRYSGRVLVLSVMLGAALGLMNLFIPMEDILKTYVVLMGVIIVIRRPFWGFAASLAGIAFLPTVTETLLILFTFGLSLLERPENPLRGKMNAYRLPLIMFLSAMVLSAVVFTLSRGESLRSLLLWG